MEPIERARLAVAIEHQYRQALYEAMTGADKDEQVEIAGAVLALMLRKMYQQRGTVWLEAILKQVLQPDVTADLPGP